MHNLVLFLSYFNSSIDFIKLESGIATTIFAFEFNPASTPFTASSKTIHSSDLTPSSFAANINISGFGLPFFILLSSPVIIKSKYSLNHSLCL